MRHLRFACVFAWHLGQWHRHVHRLENYRWNAEVLLFAFSGFIRLYSCGGFWQSERCAQLFYRVGDISLF
jgi:hypothetical protein